MARLFNHSFPGRKAALFCIEQGLILIAAFFGAALAAAILREGAAEASSATWDSLASLLAWSKPRAAGAFSWALLTSLSAATSLYAADLYNLRRADEDRSRGGRRTWIALGAVALILSLPAAMGGSEERALALGAVLAAAISVLLLRRSLPGLLGKPLRLLLIGSEEAAQRLRLQWEAGAEIEVELLRAAPEGLKEALAKEGEVDWIVAAAPLSPSCWAQLVEARAQGIPCLSVAAASERLLRRLPVEELPGEELALSEGFHLVRGGGLLKRCLDVCAAAFGLLLAAPLLALAALAIRWDSPGPIFYSQERVGWRGRVFRIRKLRTMRTDAEVEGQPKWAREDDPRITRVGRLLRKSRVDEIPQLWSVLLGDMSLVGPRPERPFFVEQLQAAISWYELRVAVRPGVTGWAQIRFPYGASVEDAKRKLEYDLYYVKNASLFLDIAIVFHTVRHVLMGRGAR